MQLEVAELGFKPRSVQLRNPYHSISLNCSHLMMFFCTAQGLSYTWITAPDPPHRLDSQSCVKHLELHHHMWLTSDQHCSPRALWGKKYKDRGGFLGYPLLSWGMMVTSKYLI